MTEKAEDQERSPRPWLALEVGMRGAALAAVAAAILFLWYCTRRYRDSVSISTEKIIKVELGLLPETPPGLTHALIMDFVFIAGYGTALIVGCALAWWLVQTEGARRGVRFGVFAALVAVAADCAENGFLLRALWGHPTLMRVDCHDAASTAAVLKYSALVPATTTAVAGLVLALLSDFRYPRAKNRLPFGDYLEKPGLNKASDHDRSLDDSGSEDRWRRGYRHPGCPHAAPSAGNRAAPDEKVVGIGLSGGGIRAASVALGVLQATGIRKEVLPRARYLVSVSGGGYMAGAFTQALTDATPDGLKPEDVIRDPVTAFAVGSPEEDYVRCRSSYLASNPAQLLVALGLLAKHLVLTVFLLFSPAILLGVAVGSFYYYVPLTKLDPSVASAPLHRFSPRLPAPTHGAWSALALTAALALLAWLASQFWLAHSNRDGRLRRALASTSHGIGGLATVVAIVTLGLPYLVWVSSWLLHNTRGTGLHVTAPIAGMLLTYVASLVSLASRKRTLLKKSAGGAVTAAVPHGVMQILLVIVALTVMAFGWLLLLGGMATVGLHEKLGPSTYVTLAVLLAALVFLGGLTDETTLSLHPFYRRRLASTFAVRRVRAGGTAEARPYALGERTTLSDYGKAPHFPHVVFAASATLGQNLTPPGANRVSYTFCSDWVGGPDLGYVRTKRLQEMAPPRLNRDLTVQSAVAISGAAIAASLGGQGSSWYQTLFVLSGVRLGAWMPNPAFLINRYASRHTPNRPSLPRTRRLNYLLRELLGIHPLDAPLVQATDGGFYENLGLVELFRRGCTEIYCVDASGDNPPAAAALAGALTLAYQELGVRTELAGKTWSTATAGSGQALAPADPLAALSARLSQTGILTGDFTYPGCAPGGPRTGKLVVAKASLWPKLPYPLLAYAQDTASFPHVSTADQWFDDKQYEAYTELGRCLGDAVAEEMRVAKRPKKSGGVGWWQRG